MGITRLELVWARQAGRTIARRALAYPPLQLSRLRYDQPAAPQQAAVTILHQAGVVQGDQYELAIRCEAGSDALVATAAATQVYRMPEAAAQQTMTIDLAAGARLHYLPEPLILCADADWTQTTNVRLAPTACLALLDVLVPGRLHRGEYFHFRRYRSLLEVHNTDGRLLLVDRVHLEPPQPSLSLLRDYPVVGTLYLLGQSYNRLLHQVRQHVAEPFLGADTLPNEAGIVVRLLGRSGHTVQRTLYKLALQTQRWLGPVSEADHS